MAAVILTGCLSTDDESVQIIKKSLKFTCIVLSEDVHSTVGTGQPFFHCPRIQINKQQKINKNFAYLITIKLVKYYPFILVLNHLMHYFYKKISFLHLSSANLIFTMKHVHFSTTYDVTGSRIYFDTFQFDVDQLCEDFVIK